MTEAASLEATTDHVCPAAARWALRLVALLGLALSGFLLYAALRAGPVSWPGCTPGSTFDCNSVLTSKWSVFWGLPVSAPAVILYIMVLAALVYVGPGSSAECRPAAWWALISLSVMAGGAAMWFVLLQVFELGSICLYCMAAHACAVVLLALVLCFAPFRGGAASRLLGPTAVVVCVLVGLVGVGGLVAGQIMYEPPFRLAPMPPGIGRDLDTGPGSRPRAITLLEQRVHLKPHEHPILGSPDAEHIMVCLFDYNCPFCHAFHAILMQMLDRYQGRVAVIMLPVPGDSACNPALTETPASHAGACARAELGLAVWRAKPEAYAEFDRWMFAADEPRPVDEARRRAVELVGQPALDTTLADPWIRQRIEANVQFHWMSARLIRRMSVPQLIVRNLIIAGRPPSAEELFRLLEQDGGVPRPDAVAPPPIPQAPSEDAEPPEAAVPSKAPA